MDSTPTIREVRALIEKYSNWGRWGDADQVGTLNFVEPAHVVRAASLIRSGRQISLALPFDSSGPQNGSGHRFNPIHLMTRDGADALAGTSVRDFYGGVDGYIRGTDDIVIMPLQSGTQWDALSHVVYEGRVYNGYGADQVTSKGALVNDVAQAADRIAGRGVLLDVARHHGVDSLEDGYAITSDDLESCAHGSGVSVGRGDFVMVRTGQLGHRRSTAWGDYAGGPAPGLGLQAVPWVADLELAGVATDTWGMEVRPNQTPDVLQPLHLVMLVHMGLWIGEIFDLDPLARDCAADGRYEFFFCAPPLPFTGAVGSPVNPIAIK